MMTVRMGISRILWIGAGVAWAAGSLIGFLRPEYWNPVTTLDWVAVWLYSAGWLVLAPAVFLLGLLSSSRAVRGIALVVAIACLAAGVANGFEDGLGWKDWGILYVIGSITTLVGLIALSMALGRAGLALLGWLTAGLLLGFVLFPAGGGLITLAALGALAVVPDRFTQRLATPGAVPA
jgi:hypothetical protein